MKQAVSEPHLTISLIVSSFWLFGLLNNIYTNTKTEMVCLISFLVKIYVWFHQWMENHDCEEVSVYPCCSQSTFPYKQEVFELCIKRAIMELDRTTNYHLDSKTPGPRFDINDTIRAIVLEFQSTYLFTLAYEKMYQFYHEVRPADFLQWGMFMY